MEWGEEECTMSEMIAEVYNAFKRAGVPDEDAQAAATALTQLQDEPWKRKIEKELRELRTEIVELRGSHKLNNWMIATNIALTAAVLFKLPSV